MIHLEGMGWLGAVLAFRLDREGVPFTWHDIDAPYVAWRASTGLVYPAGDARSQAGLAGWGQWARDGWLPAGTVEQVGYVYAHKAPPHQGRYRTVPLAPGVTLADAPAFAVHVPRVVEAARQRFAERRRAGRPAGAVTVQAHGSARARAVMWGWSAPVRLALPAQVAELPYRAAFYGRRVRRLVYAYPIPGRAQWWWAGSALVRQTRPRRLDTARQLARWDEDWQAVWPQVHVMERARVVEGWRPRPADGDQAGVVTDVGQGVVTVPALWHSGVRWAPGVVREVMNVLAVWGEVIPR
ncbi:hypothetical protein [Frankia sp. AvcI1]|uniref:hypothetical protein n=1 Tax=Frankia sp. AvcI1 TaxID=573496 RepID=UPI0021198586|nr:hypothetical protein [Frankia sp. AvcI1]